jgi:hypothetical protein
VSKAAQQQAYQSRLAAQWAVFFERTRREFAYRPMSFTLPGGRRYTPDFHVFELGWIALSEAPSLYAPQTRRVPGPPARRVRESFSRFFEFASSCEQWCYWLGGAIPFWALSEVRELVAPTLKDLHDPDWMRRAERLRQEWPDGYGWYKLRRHDGPRQLPTAAEQCGPILAKLQGGANFKTHIMDSEAFSAFDHKSALVAARSAAL